MRKGQQLFVDLVVTVGLLVLEPGAGQVEQRLDQRHPLRLGAVIQAAHDQVGLVGGRRVEVVALVDQKGHVTEGSRRADHVGLLHGKERGAGVLDVGIVLKRPDDGEAPDLPEVVEPVLGAQKNAEIVARAAAAAPVERVVLCLVGNQVSAVRKHHVDRQDAVAVHAVYARGEAVPAALHVAARADVGTATPGNVQSIGV